MGAHHDAVEGVAALVAGAIEGHAHGECRAVLRLAQGAEIVGDALGQHGHDAVGEIDRVAARPGLAVHRGAGRHVGRDVRDGDGDDPAALVGRIVVRRGVDGVVMVLGRLGVDGEEGEGAPVLTLEILALAQADGRSGLRLGQHVGREDMADVVRMDGDEADGLLGGRIGDDLADLGLRQSQSVALAIALAAAHRDGDEVTVPRPLLRAGRDAQLAPAGLLVDRQHAAALLARPKDAERRALVLRQHLDDAARVGRVLAGDLVAMREHAVAAPRLRLVASAPALRPGGGGARAAARRRRPNASGWRRGRPPRPRRRPRGRRRPAARPARPAPCGAARSCRRRPSPAAAPSAPPGRSLSG